MPRQVSGHARNVHARNVRYAPHQAIHKAKQVQQKPGVSRKGKKRSIQKVYVHLKQPKRKEQQMRIKLKPTAKASSKQLARMQDDHSQSCRDLSEIYSIKPKLSASRRCARWLVGMPHKQRWSTGTTQSTISIEGARPKTEKYMKRDTTSHRKVEQARLREVQSHQYPGYSYYKKGKNPHVSAKHVGERMYEEHTQSPSTTNGVYGERSEHGYHHQNPRHVSRDGECSKFVDERCPPWSNLNYPNHCRQCLKKKWENRSHKRTNEHTVHKKQRNGYCASKKHKDASSMGWAILQVIKQLGRNKAYPLAILEVLKRKWGFPKLNLLGLNNALRWMEHKRLVCCQVKMNTHYPKFQVDTRGEMVLSKRMQQCQQQAAYSHRQQFRHPTAAYHSKPPYNAKTRRRRR